MPPTSTTNGPARLSLTDFDGTVVRLRFAFRSNFSSEHWGVYIDDLGITLGSD